MAKAIVTAQISYNGATSNATPIVLNTKNINGVQSETTGATIYYKNLDGSMVNLIGSNDIVADLLIAMNAATTTDVTMLTLPNAVDGMDMYIPTSAIYMASELDNGNCLVTYATSANDSLIQAEIELTAVDIADAMNA